MKSNFRLASGSPYSIQETEESRLIQEAKTEKINALRKAWRIKAAIKQAESGYAKWHQWVSRIGKMCLTEQDATMFLPVLLQFVEEYTPLYKLNQLIVIGWSNDLAMIDNRKPLTGFSGWMLPSPRMNFHHITNIQPECFGTRLYYPLFPEAHQVMAILRLALMLSGGDDLDGVRLEASLLLEILGDKASDYLRDEGDGPGLAKQDYPFFTIAEYREEGCRKVLFHKSSYPPITDAEQGNSGILLRKNEYPKTIS